MPTYETAVRTVQIPTWTNRAFILGCTGLTETREPHGLARRSVQAFAPFTSHLSRSQR
jgi:hypothetical protein